MPKESGIGGTITIDDSAGTARDISQDVMSVNAGTPRGVQELRGINKTAMERILLVRDGTISLSGVFNPSTNMSHDVFKTIATSNTLRTVVWALDATPDATLTMEMIFSNYALSTAEDGALTWSVEGMLADGTDPAWS